MYKSQKNLLSKEHYHLEDSWGVRSDLRQDLVKTKVLVKDASDFFYFEIPEPILKNMHYRFFNSFSMSEYEYLVFDVHN
jgi:hypothetical protein